MCMKLRFKSNIAAPQKLLGLIRYIMLTAQKSPEHYAQKLRRIYEIEMGLMGGWASKYCYLPVSSHFVAGPHCSEVLVDLSDSDVAQAPGLFTTQ